MWNQKPPLGTPLDWGNPLNDGTVLAPAMNEGHGDIVRDLSMNGNHGTLHNFAFPPTVVSGWNPGQTGIGLNFDGIDDYITPKNIIAYSTEYTIAFLAYPTSNLFRQTVLKDQTGGDYGKGCIMNAAGIWTIRSTAVGGAGVLEANNYEQDVWQHLVFTQSGGVCTIYYDGVFDKSGAFTPITRTTRICGDYGAASENDYQGKIDQLRVMNRAWTAKEVKDYYINPWQVYLDEND